MRRVALLFLVAPVLAACGGHSYQARSTDAQAQKIVRQALLKTASAPSAHLTIGLGSADEARFGSGDIDSRRHIVWIRFEPNRFTPRAMVLAGQTIYYRFPGHRWARARQPRSPLVYSALMQPELFFGHLRILRVTRIGAGQFRVWAAALRQPIDMWVSQTGYVTRLKAAWASGEIQVDLSRFGEHVHLAVPA